MHQKNNNNLLRTSKLEESSYYKRRLPILLGPYVTGLAGLVEDVRLDI